ncbi:MAG: fatty acid desaturase [Sphingobacteriaceae bacterium]
MSVKKTHTGEIIALIVLSVWAFVLCSLLGWNFSWTNPLAYLMILVQAHLYTGLFITAHDAMHGTVSANKTLNNFIGGTCTLLYALFPFGRLYSKHHEHHRQVHSAGDPDYHEGSFWAWYLNFMRTYITWWQILAMAVLYNLLKIFFAEANVLLFWVVPALLSTLQLFYFGTWLPHHGQHENKHHSRSLQKNHLLAFFTCYFFGYHYEHHDSPGTPWWKLWALKEKAIFKG